MSLCSVNFYSARSAELSGKFFIGTMVNRSALPIRIAIVAGEPSGDNLGAGLIRAIHDIYSDVEFVGVGGSQMREAGCDILYQMDRIGVMGLDGIIGKIWDILSIRKSLYKRFTTYPPDVFVGIDVPDFNLTLERRLKKKGIPCIHYVSPTVWAWRGYRIHKIRRSVTHMLTLFPFEDEYYHQNKIPVTYVGHPIADEINQPDKLRARSDLGLNERDLIIALLPGSRRSEVKKLGPLFIESAERLYKFRKEIKFILPFTNQSMADELRSIIKITDQIRIRLVIGCSRPIMEASDIVILASGTAALEATLLRRPHIVVYKLSTFSYWLMHKLRHVDYYSMTNHLLPTPIIPELIQNKATAKNIVTEVQRYLEDPRKLEQLETDFAKIHRKLKLDANLRARNAVLKLIDTDEVT